MSQLDEMAGQWLYTAVFKSDDGFDMHMTHLGDLTCT